MRIFGKAIGGGRRQSSREAMPMPALVNSVRKSQVVVLGNLSATGARFRGSDLPGEGERVSLIVDCVRAVGTVAWARDGECGVEFDSALLPFEAERLRRQFTTATVTYRSVDERLALDELIEAGAVSQASLLPLP